LREVSGEIYRQSQQEAITRLISKLWKGRDYKINAPLARREPTVYVDRLNNAPLARREPTVYVDRLNSAISYDQVTSTEEVYYTSMNESISVW
jgi:hypothetical protein